MFFYCDEEQLKSSNVTGITSGGSDAAGESAGHALALREEKGRVRLVDER